MCPERLPEPGNAGPQAGGRRASLARSGRARDPTKWSRAQQVKLVVWRRTPALIYEGRRGYVKPLRQELNLSQIELSFFM